MKNNWLLETYNMYLESFFMEYIQKFYLDFR